MDVHPRSRADEASDEMRKREEELSSCSYKEPQKWSFRCYRLISRLPGLVHLTGKYADNNHNKHALIISGMFYPPSCSLCRKGSQIYPVSCFYGATVLLPRTSRKWSKGESVNHFQSAQLTSGCFPTVQSCLRLYNQPDTLEKRWPLLKNPLSFYQNVHLPQKKRTWTTPGGSLWR